MAQMSADLQDQISGLSDSFAALNNAVTNTAGTPGAPPNSIVKLDFFESELKDRLLVLQGNILQVVDLDHTRLLTSSQEFIKLKQAVQENNEFTRLLIEEEQSTNKRLRENLEMSFGELQVLVNQDRTFRAQTQADHESLKSQIRSLEARVSVGVTPQGLTPPQGAPSFSLNKLPLSSRKGVEHITKYNGEGGSEKWKEWRFAFLTWVEQESPTLAKLIRRVEKLESEPKEPQKRGRQGRPQTRRLRQH